jgi:diaminopimelate decarboxylase
LASLTPFQKVARLDWRSCDRVCLEQGGAFYLADLDHFADNCTRMLGAFRAAYPNTRIGYSLKTNYLPAFVRRAHALGAYAEVVSGFELQLAEQLGVPGPDILFNGPVKRPEDLRRAFAIGARVNADSAGELQVMGGLARELDRTVAVGVRCHLGDNTPDSRFGLDLRTPEGTGLLAELARDPHLRLAGLHCHHSGRRTVERYRARTAAMVALHRDVLQGCPLDYIDVGGGFASAMSPALAAQIPDPAATFEQYADAVAGEMYRAYGRSGPELILEPGMAVLADAMVFVARVEAVKVVGRRRLAVVDGSVFNIKPLRGGVNLPVAAIPREPPAPAPAAPCDIVGNTCMEIDTLHSGYRGSLREGDFVAFENVGAYSTVLNAPFIHGTPAIVELAGARPGRTLRRASTAADLLRGYEAGE